MIPFPTVCNQCEDKVNLVTDVNGMTLKYPILDNVQLNVILHNTCVAIWCSDFGITPPGGTASINLHGPGR